jgi:hypothetical protein
MKKQFILLLITIISINGYSQIKYEKGYYIDNNDKKVDVLIKNIDWLNNPKEIQYKIDDSAESEKIAINSAKEFGIYGVSKYIRAKVSMDKSSNNTDNLSSSKDPEFKEETVFLKVLILGKANLYAYQENGPGRFFYSTENSNIQQLIFKRYKTDGNKIAKNKAYKQQLFTNLKCQNITLADIENINYNENELSNLFVKYNECESALSTDFNKQNTQQSFHLNIRPGINVSSYDLKYGNQYTNQNFDKSFKLGYRIGVEAEVNLAFNKNKWALFIEPTYQQLKYTKTVYNQNMTIDYKSIELPLGIRYYFFLNKESSKLFLNLSYTPQLTLNSGITLENNDDVKIEGSSYFAVGAGYKFKNKYMAEIRYGFDREILESNLTWYSSLNTLSIILGYRIF